MLSDTLIQIGRTANPKNNLSMAETEEAMRTELLRAQYHGTPDSQIHGILKYACEKLNKEGYKYYNPSHFLQTA